MMMSGMIAFVVDYDDANVGVNTRESKADRVYEKEDMSGSYCYGEKSTWLSTCKWCWTLRNSSFIFPTNNFMALLYKLFVNKFLLYASKLREHFP